MLLSIALVLASQNPKLDFHCNATNLSSILASLSKQVGTKLEAEGTLGNQILFIDVKDVPLSSLKEKIAHAVAGTWRQREGREVILRLPAQETGVFNEQVKVRTEQFRAELATQAKALDKPFDAKALLQGLLAIQDKDGVQLSRAQYEQQMALQARSPYSRFLTRLLLAARPEDLAAVGPYERRLFKLNPTRRQSGLDRAKYQAAVKILEAEQKQWLEAIAGIDFTSTQGRTVSDPRTQTQPVDPNAEYMITFSRGDMTGLGMANLGPAKDADDHTGQSVMMQIHLAGPQRDFLNGLANQRASGTDPEVELSPLSKAFLTRFMQFSQARSTGAPSEEVKSLLMNPHKTDPLALIVSDTLKQYAAVNKANVVACLPDSAFMWSTAIAANGNPRLMTMIDGLRQSDSLEHHKDDGWTTFTPINRYEEELNFTARVPLADLMASIERHGRLDLEDYATYAYRSGRVARLAIGEYYLMILDSTLMSGMDQTNWFALRLYGSLNEKEREKIASGGSIPIASMSPGQKAIVERMIFRDALRSETITDTGWSMSLGPRAVEPSDAYANKVPDGAMLTGRKKDVPVLFAYGKREDGKVRPLREVDPYGIAHMETEIVGNVEQMKNYGIPNLVGYAPATSRKVVLRIVTEPGVWLEAAVKTHLVDPNASPVAWDKLSDQSKNEISKAMEILKKQKEERKKGPPPPQSQGPSRA